MNSAVEEDAVPLNLHAILPRSRANGPGQRFVVWFQGCARNCPGCFNPETHSHAPHLPHTVGALCAEIAAVLPPVDGVTISGGEPFEQMEGLLALLRCLRRERGLPVVVFSGFTLNEIRRQPLGEEALNYIDLLVAGPYNAAQPAGSGLLGSANQRLHFLTDRYTEADIARVPTTEVRLSADGLLHVTGIAPARLQERECG